MEKVKRILRSGQNFLICLFIFWTTQRLYIFILKFPDLYCWQLKNLQIQPYHLKILLQMTLHVLEKTSQIIFFHFAIFSPISLLQNVIMLHIMILHFLKHLVGTKPQIREQMPGPSCIYTQIFSPKKLVFPQKEILSKFFLTPKK